MKETSAELFKRSQDLQEESLRLGRQALGLRQKELEGQPIAQRLVYAATSRCLCGAGLAYDPVGPSGSPATGYWDCANILCDTADRNVKHEQQMPFMFWSIKSEKQPSAYGQTTRPKNATLAEA